MPLRPGEKPSKDWLDSVSTHDLKNELERRAGMDLARDALDQMRRQLSTQNEVDILSGKCTVTMHRANWEALLKYTGISR